MSFDVRNHIKNHAIAFGTYSLLCVVLIYISMVPDDYTAVVVMILYACLLGLHAIIALFDMIILSKSREARLKGILVILAIGIIGFGLCMSPSIWY